MPVYAGHYLNSIFFGLNVRGVPNINHSDSVRQSYMVVNPLAVSLIFHLVTSNGVYNQSAKELVRRNKHVAIYLLKNSDLMGT